MKTIIVSGGKTLGHVTPGISVVNRLHEKYKSLRIIYVTCDNQIDLYIVKSSSSDKVIFFNLDFKNKLHKIRKCFEYYDLLSNICKTYNPVCIISFGSLIGTLLVMAGKRLNIKTVIHEQNACFGLGNKIVRRKADLVLSNFPLKKESKKFKVVGNPILIENSNFLLTKNKTKLVITSGSNGSKSFVRLGIDMYNSGLFKDYDITFITGKRYHDEVIEKIQETNNFHVLPFVDNLSVYLQDVSFIITRGGSITLSEIYYLNIYPIIIPSPNVTNNHQYKNAVMYPGECSIFNDCDISVDKISNVLEKCDNKKILNPKINSTSKFIEELEHVVKLY